MVNSKYEAYSSNRLWISREGHKFVRTTLDAIPNRINQMLDGNFWGREQVFFTSDIKVRSKFPEINQHSNNYGFFKPAKSEIKSERPDEIQLIPSH